MYYVSPSWIPWRAIRKLMRGLFVAWTIGPLLMSSLGLIGFLIVSDHGQPFLTLAQALVSTGQDYRPTGSPDVYIHSVCITTFPQYHGEVLPNSPHPPTLVDMQPIPPTSSELGPAMVKCADQTITLPQIAKNLRSSATFTYCAFGIIFSLGYAFIFLLQTVEHLTLELHVRRGNKPAWPPISGGVL